MCVKGTTWFHLQTGQIFRWDFFLGLTSFLERARGQDTQYVVIPSNLNFHPFCGTFWAVSRCVFEGVCSLLPVAQPQKK